MCYIGPLCVRFKREPLFAYLYFYATVTLFKSYPTIGDTSFGLTLMLIVYPFLTQYTRRPYISVLLFLLSCRLGFFNWYHPNYPYIPHALIDCNNSN